MTAALLGFFRQRGPVHDRMSQIRSTAFLAQPYNVTTSSSPGHTFTAPPEQGFRLADATVTQALWEEEMGDNPGRFKGPGQLPVDSVSWEDGQRFLLRLKERVEGLSAGLPCEAQWEYACRAGSLTPFSFGETITPEQVNYNGEQVARSAGREMRSGRTGRETWRGHEG